MASTGLSLIFFYLIATVIYLIPSTMIYAELASTWPEAGGIYAWSRNAFGEKAALVAVWSEWFNNIAGMPTSLSFLAAATAYIINPSLANSGVYIFVVMLMIVWSITFLNFLAIKKSTILNALGAWFGVFIPAILIVVLAAAWLISGNKSQIAFKASDIIPKLNAKNLVFLLSVFSSYAGMQILGFHARNVENPKTDIPRAMFRSVIFIVLATTLAALAIAIVVPHSQLSFVSGFYEGFSLFLTKFHAGWAIYFVVLMLFMSGASLANSWLVGPARAISAASQGGLFPSWLGKENKHGMPVNVLLFQGLVVSALSLLFLFAHGLSTAFWLLMVLTSQFTLVLDIIIFGAVIKMRYKCPDKERPYKIPGGKLVVWLISGVTIVSCVVAIILGFVPPDGLDVGNVVNYEIILITGNACYVIVPFVIYKLNKKSKSTGL